jgi:CTP synthase
MQVEDPDAVKFILVSYLPVPPSIGEMKTKPTQYAVRTLNATGIQPNFVIGRSTVEMDQPRKEKIARFCSVPPGNIISAPDAESIYHIPEMFEDQGLATKILEEYGLKEKKNDLSEWKAFTDKIKNATDTVKIGVVGKYFSTGDFTLSDAYISVLEALKHAAAHVGVKAEIDWLNSEEYEKEPEKLKELSDYDGILIPGGFGSRGIEGKIEVIKYVRENKIPYFGICYGMQCAVIEFARTKLGWSDAHTAEINPDSSKPVIDVMEDQKKKLAKEDYGGTMRLGSYDCKLAEGSKSREVYGEESISERHRHRYEMNNQYRKEIEEAGLSIAGVNPAQDLVEIVEVKDHPFFVGVQFHPEFQSRPLSPHPLFKGFIKAASER